jgi:hypothetical protein
MRQAASLLAAADEKDRHLFRYVLVLMSRLFLASDSSMYSLSPWIRFTIFERELHALQHKLRVSKWYVPTDDWASAKALITELQARMVFPSRSV